MFEIRPCLVHGYYAVVDTRTGDTIGTYWSRQTAMDVAQALTVVRTEHNHEYQPLQSFFAKLKRKKPQ